MRGREFTRHFLIPGMRGLFMFDFKMHSSHLLTVTIEGLTPSVTFDIQMSSREDAFAIIKKRDRIKEVYPGILEIENKISEAAMEEMIKRGFKSSAGDLYYD